MSWPTPDLATAVRQLRDNLEQRPDLDDIGIPLLAVLFALTTKLESIETRLVNLESKLHQ